MVSARALPPGIRLGSADLKRNARRFLERGLLISALVHLAALSLFRIAADREAARFIPDFRRTPGRIDVIRVRTMEVMPPLDGATSPPGTAKDGEIVPVRRTDDRVDLRDWVKGLAGPTLTEGVRDPDVTGRGSPLPPPPDKPDPFRAGVENPPVPLVAPKPAYPSWAEEARIEGEVLLRVLVGKDGLVRNVVIIRGPKGLDEEAARAVRHWTFRPATTNGQPLEVWVEVPLSFRL